MTSRKGSAELVLAWKVATHFYRHLSERFRACISHQVLQHFVQWGNLYSSHCSQELLGFQLPEGCTAVRALGAGHRKHSLACVWVKGQNWVYRITFLIFGSAASGVQWREDTSAQVLLGAGSLSEKVKIQPRQLLKRWAASSRGLSSWGGWIWRSLSAGHELNSSDPNCCPPGLVTGKLMIFSSCLCCREQFLHLHFLHLQGKASSWNGLAGIVIRIVWSFSDGANGWFNGMKGKLMEW